MDSLICSIEKFAITNNKQEFEDSLDNVINNFDKFYIEIDNGFHWNFLKENYTKIKYISQIMNSVKNSTKFLEVLEKFMKKIDNINEIYIESIDWDESLEYGDVRTVQNLLIEAQIQFDIHEKIKQIVQAYSILVPIIEAIRNEKYTEQLDEKFVNQFQPFTQT